MNKISIWAAAARPKTLPISIGPALLGCILSLNEGYFNFFLFCMTVLCALGIQICANLANDYFDFIKGADTKERKGPLRVTQAGLVSLSQMKKGLFVSFGLTALLSSYLILHGGITIAILTSLSLLFAALYTAGPFPLAYLGLGDLFVFVFFGPVAVSGAYFLQTGFFAWTPAILGIGAGMLSVTPLAINNIRDEKEDLKANKKTLVVRFGKTFGLFEYVLCIASAAFVPLLFFKTHPFALLSELFLIPAFFMIRAIFTYKEPKELNDVLAKTGKLLLLYYFLLCIGWGIH